MPRSARLNLPGGVFHVISRFARDERVFRGPTQRAAYLAQLGAALKKTDAQVLAYVLMSTHVHLVVVQGQEPLERLFKPLHTGFALWVNRRRGRTKKAQGAVVAGRPRTILVEEERYLRELVRYIHNNPVRGGVARHAVQSDWSSHQAYVGLVQTPAWLNVAYVLERFGARTPSARRAFEAFVRTGEKDARNRDLSGDPESEVMRRARAVLGDGFRLSDAVLGSEEFAAKVARDARSARETLGRGRVRLKRGAWEGVRPTLNAVIDAVLQSLKLDPVVFSERPMGHVSQLARQVIVWIWVHHIGGKQVEVARTLNVPSYSVARWYGKAVAHAAELQELSEAILHLLVHGGRARVTKTATRYRYQVEVE